ncbi:MAG: hypothetical protein RLN62_01580 [Rickettsiales bacterium]
MVKPTDEQFAQAIRDFDAAETYADLVLAIETNGLDGHNKDFSSTIRRSASTPPDVKEKKSLILEALSDSSQRMNQITLEMRQLGIEAESEEEYVERALPLIRRELNNPELTLEEAKDKFDEFIAISSVRSFLNDFGAEINVATISNVWPAVSHGKDSLFVSKSDPYDYEERGMTGPISADESLNTDEEFKNKIEYAATQNPDGISAIAVADSPAHWATLLIDHRNKKFRFINPRSNPTRDSELSQRIKTLFPEMEETFSPLEQEYLRSVDQENSIQEEIKEISASISKVLKKVKEANKEYKKLQKSRTKIKKEIEDGEAALANSTGGSRESIIKESLENLKREYAETGVEVRDFEKEVLSPEEQAHLAEMRSARSSKKTELSEVKKISLEKRSRLPGQGDETSCGFWVLNCAESAARTGSIEAEVNKSIDSIRVSALREAYKQAARELQADYLEQAMRLSRDDETPEKDRPVPSPSGSRYSPSSILGEEEARELLEAGRELRDFGVSDGAATHKPSALRGPKDQKKSR